jgi:hypothetical protein
VLVAGLAEVYVNVDEARSHDEAVHVHDLGIIRTDDAWTAGFDATVLYQKSSRPIQLLRRIQQPSARDQHRPAHSLASFADSARSGLPPASR